MVLTGQLEICEITKCNRKVQHKDYLDKIKNTSNLK